MIEETEGLAKAREMATQADRLYPELKRKADESIARWEWGDFTLYSLEPCYFELNKFPRGKPLDREPDPPTEASGYGFDSSGRLIAEIDQTNTPGRCSETYYVYESEGIAQYCYHYEPSHPWQSVRWMPLDSLGRITSIAFVSVSGNYGTESFTYDRAGRAVSAHRHFWDTLYGEFDDVREIEYDEHGNVSRTVWVSLDGTRTIDFERPRPGRTLMSTRDAMHTRLVQAIHASLREACPDSPVYALALSYSDEQYEHRLPPDVSFATEDDLKEFRDEHPDELWYFAWYPPDWKGYLTLELDETFLDLCHSVNEDIWQNDLYDEVRSLLEEIARTLSNSELPVPRSDMFVAYVIDVDSGETVPDVLRSASPETANLLKARGLL